MSNGNSDIVRQPARLLRIPPIYKVKAFAYLPVGGLLLARVFKPEKPLPNTTADTARKRNWRHKAKALAEVEAACLGRLSGKVGSKIDARAAKQQAERARLVKNRTRYIQNDAPVVAGMRVVSMGDAKLLNLNRYFTGEPCPFGHVAQRSVRTGVCCGCSDAKRAQKAARDELAREIRADRRKAVAERRADPEWRKQYRREYYARNKARFLASSHRRRDRVRESPGHFTAADVERIKGQQKNRCGACRKPLKKYHIDHHIPLARGGTNEARNIQLLCPSCNHSKSARDPIEFMQSKFGRLL